MVSEHARAPRNGAKGEKGESLRGCPIDRLGHCGDRHSYALPRVERARGLVVWWFRWEPLACLRDGNYQSDSDLISDRGRR